MGSRPGLLLKLLEKLQRAAGDNFFVQPEDPLTRRPKKTQKHEESTDFKAWFLESPLSSGLRTGM